MRTGDNRPPPELGELLVAYLEQLNIDYVFGVPGGAIEPFYNALARSERKGGVRALVARHETGAAFMADGYSRQTGKLGVCCSTTGPGATNLLTGVASAYENELPMLVITAQTALMNFGRGALQESSCTGINTVGIYQYCTRYNSFVSHPSQFERKLIAAIMSAFSTPKGPVHLSIPLDLLRSPAPVFEPSYDLAKLLHQPALLDPDAVQTCCEYVAAANNVVFVIGDGCNEAIGTLEEIALRLQAPIITTPHGKGLISPYHPLFRGVIGFAGHRTAEETLTDKAVDLIVAVGTNMGEWASSGWDPSKMLNERLIHIDASEGHLARSPMAKLHVRGRISTVIEHIHEYLLEHTEAPLNEAHAERIQLDSESPRDFIRPQYKRYFQMDQEGSYYDDSTPIKPQRLMHELGELFPPNTRFLADPGNSMTWSIHYLHPFDRRIAGRREAHGGVYRSSLEFASMGWAVGAAVGVALGNPGNPVVCIVGDGSWLMSGQEITVAIQHKLPIIYVILNDAALGMVKHGQRLAEAEPIGWELPEIDYSVYAESIGAAGYVINSPQDLLDLDIEAICNHPGPSIFDARIDPEAVPPMAARMRVLELGIAA